MIPFGISLIEASLFTWEYVSPFDEIPDMKRVYRAFEREFRNHFRLLHLLSFNSGEYCCSRYLVVMPENQLPYTRKRLLPRQIALLAAADRAIRMQKNALDNSGNIFCYAVDNKKFKVLVFFEGRLCHWSESELEDSSIENENLELERFRRFLKTDTLFSRVKAFSEIRIEGIRRSDLKKAVRDPLWRSLNLQNESRAKGKKSWLWYALVLLLAVVVLKMFNVGWFKPVTEIPDSALVELEEPPAWIESTEPMAKVELRSVGGAKISRCILPNFKLKGVIAAKLVMVDVEGNSSTKFVGDSLGSFKVLSIGGNGVGLACGDSLLYRSVEPCCR